MKMKKRVYAVFIILALVISFGVYRLSAENEDTFETLLEYEVNNRAFARMAMAELSKETSDTQKTPFWKAYLALENFSFQKYEPVVAAYNIRPNMTIASIKNQSSKIALSVAPQSFYKLMYQSTADYVERLQSLPVLCEPKLINFCNYVVAQETAQLRAMEYILTDDWTSATIVIDEFVASQR
ncbi:hypothetical protein [Kordiimonas sp. SCSIO 12610]|uniref:hypothetical protein n=1 Tax=Kordiimonas sp. SCSIO 12610 TaxID=2829597 RepID=UPI002108D9DE|nr:hypothetical protein [Kordiimonas sp. SCSIO 12610]UTW55679.1 hypothetical protein KFF44_01950 [Kordiimonas sp. SCSIO 12610]